RGRPETKPYLGPWEESATLRRSTRHSAAAASARKPSPKRAPVVLPVVSVSSPHHIRSHETTYVAQRTHEGDARSGGRPAQKRRRHTPKRYVETVDADQIGRAHV